MSVVTTELVIDADTSGADRFSQAMAGAERAANSGLSGISTGVLALGTGAAAALLSIKGVVDYVVGANKDLADMATVAHQVGLSLADIQAIKLGGAISGLNPDQINAGLEKSASLLNDASRNSNSLSKELEANGISLKNSNGQLITENQLLGIAADLIKNAKNPGDQMAIAQMLGFTKEWIPLLEQGSTAMSGLTAEAKAAGAIINDETIDRASKFDAEWRKSSVEFSYYMKAALSDLLPFIDDLIERASRFVQSLDRNKIEKAANEQLKQLSDATGIPEAGGIKIGITPETVQAIDDFKNASFFSLEFWASAGRVFGSSVQAISPQDVKWVSGTDPVRDTSNIASQQQWAMQGDLLSKGSSIVNQYRQGKPSVVASREVQDDAVDRAINSMQKHTQATLANAEAVGKGDAALAGLRVDAAETAAVMANGGKETDAQVDKFNDLRDAAEAAAEALSKEKVASSISVGRQTAFLSSGDIAIAQQLKGLYGDDIPRALASTEYAALKVNAAFREVSSGIENNLTSGLTDIVSGAKSASQGFTDMSNAIVKAIEQMIIKITIVEPLMRGLQQAAGGLGGLGGLSGLFGSASSSVAPVTQGLSSLPAIYGDGTNSAPGGWSIVGDKGPELVNLSPGAQVVPHGAWSGGGSNDNGSRAPNIIINNHTDAQPQVATGSNGDITITMKKAVDDMVGESLSSGTGMRVLKKQYGVTPFSGQ